MLYPIELRAQVTIVLQGLTILYYTIPVNPNLYILLLLFELFFVMGLGLYTVGLLYSSVMGAPYVPTSQKRIGEILKAAKLKKGQVFLELGSGDGRIVREAVKSYGVKGIGVDINALLIFLSRFYAKHQGLKEISFRRENIFSTEISMCDVLYLFLMPELLRKMKSQFETKLKKGTLVISHGFKLEGWEKKLIHHIPTEPFSTFFYHV